MLKHASLWTAALAVLVLQVTPQVGLPADAASAWLPDGVSAEEVGSELRINGLATRVLRLRGAASMLQLRDAFQAGVHASSGVLPTGSLEGWQLHARRFGRGFQTLQMRADGQGGVEALLATTDLSLSARATPVAPLSLAGAAQVTSVVESNDAGTAATQYVAWSPLPVASLRRLLCQRASSDGWRVASCDTAVVDLSRPSRSLVMSVMEIPAAAQGRTTMRAIVVLNELRSIP
jgi:hypothetical protein